MTNYSTFWHKIITETHINCLCCLPFALSPTERQISCISNRQTRFEFEPYPSQGLVNKLSMLSVS